jgi:hypothetical protein
MKTVAGSGASNKPETLEAVQEAIGAARAGLAGRPATYGFLFVSPKHELGTALDAAAKSVNGADLIGCTTAGEFTERGRTQGGIAALLVATDGKRHAKLTAKEITRDPSSAAKKLCAPYASLASECKARGQVYSTSVVLVDGLSGVGATVVDEIRKNTRSINQIVGGAAGDDGAFAATLVGDGASAQRDSAAVLHAFGETPWGIGVDHGLRPKTSKMRVTKAEKNIVYEIDGRPAFEAYKTYAKTRGVELEPSTAGRFLIGNELGVYYFDKLQTARAPLGVLGDGALKCAADVERGSYVSILDGEPESMISAARAAAREAREQLKGTPAAAVLVFDCVCRGMILDERFQGEIDAVRTVFPDAPIAGFLTYGEIARSVQRLDGWHNATAVVAAIPAS